MCSYHWQKGKSNNRPLENPPFDVLETPTNTVLAVHRYADKVEKFYRPLLS